MTLIIRIHTQAVQTRTEEILIKHENLIITDDVQSTVFHVKSMFNNNVVNCS